MVFKSPIKSVLSPFKRNNEDCEQNDADMKQSKVDTPKNDEETQRTNNQDYRKLLSPCEISNKDKAHRSVDELKFAIDSVNCTNIAVTGGYGSGKSSVIKTYLKENPHKKVFSISLSNYNDVLEKKLQDEESSQQDTEQSQQSDQQQTKQTNNSTTNLENLLEYKIFQLLFYKSDQSKTPQSKYKRVPFITKCQAIKFSLFAAFIILSFVVIIEPDIPVLGSMLYLYDICFGCSNGFNVRTTFVILAFFYLLFCTSYCVFLFVRHWKGHFIKSLKAKDVELVFDENKSVFSDYLEDILYFFKANKYDIILFEDIDRIKDTQNLFLKLREINILLNESEYFKSHERTIKFVYAIRDDLFSSELRTKCFDYIVPIVPVVNKNNAGDYLIENYGKNILEGISITDLYELGLFVHDIRQLNNIVNEFNLYKDVVVMSGMSLTKLLAITIYKNLYPEDYSSLQQNKGCLYEVFTQKELFDILLLDSTNTQINNLENAITNETSDLHNKRMEIINLLVTKFQVEKLIVDGIEYECYDFADNDDLFYSIENDKVEEYIYINGNETGKLKYSATYSELIDGLGDGDHFEAKMNETINSLAENKKKLKKLKNDASAIHNTSLQEKIHTISDGVKTKEIVEKICCDACNANNVTMQDGIADTIHAFVRNGFITDDYKSYLSYYYPGSLCEEDSKFLHSVLQGIELSYDYKINDPKQVIKRLHTDNFRNKECLNIHLISYILNSNDESRISIIVQNLRQHPDYLVAFYQSGKCSKSNIDIIFTKWNHCIRDVYYSSNDFERSTFYAMLFIASPTSIAFDMQEIGVLNNKYQLICSIYHLLDDTKINDFISRNNLKFNKLVESEQTGIEQLFDYVTLNKHFEINFSNLLLIYGEDFNKRSYQCIIEGKDKIKEYLDANISTVVDLFPNSDNLESIDTFVALSNNEDITDEQFGTFLRRQLMTIDTLNDIGEFRRKYFFMYDKIKATWVNVQKYFEVDNDLEVIVQFIIRHSHALSSDFIEEDDNMKLQIRLFGDNQTLPMSVYQELISCCQHRFLTENLSSLNDERLKLVVKNGLVDYSENTKQLFATKGDDLFAQFLITNFDHFIEDREFNINLTNKVSITLLNADVLTLEQKKQYINSEKLGMLIDEGIEEIEEISKTICDLLLKIGVFKDLKFHVLGMALIYCHEPYPYTNKLTLINDYNDVCGYNFERVKSLIGTLDKPYDKLCKYRGRLELQKTIQNERLTTYLKVNNWPYIKQVTPEGDKIKITLKYEPKTH